MSNDKKRGLGRGLSALIPVSQEEPAPTPGRPSDVFFNPDSSVSRPKGGSARDLLGPRNPKRVSRETQNSKAPVKNDDNEAVASKELVAELIPVPGATFGDIEIDEIVPNTKQPRQVFDEEELAELAASIKEVGVLQPVVVRPLDAAGIKEFGAHYELVMGERRWRASRLAGNETVPAIVRRTQEEDLLRDALLENLHRSELNPLEEAAAYRQLLDDFGCTQTELAERIARSRPRIANTLRLLNLPGTVQARLASGVLSAGHARALLGLTNTEAIEKLAKRIVTEGLSVRNTEEIVAIGDVSASPVSKRKKDKKDTELPDHINYTIGRLSDQLETDVRILTGKKGGRIVIRYANDEDLGRITGLISK